MRDHIYDSQFLHKLTKTKKRDKKYSKNFDEYENEKNDKYTELLFELIKNDKDIEAYRIANYLEQNYVKKVNIEKNIHHKEKKVISDYIELFSSLKDSLEIQIEDDEYNLTPPFSFEMKLNYSIDKIANALDIASKFYSPNIISNETKSVLYMNMDKTRNYARVEKKEKDYFRFIIFEPPLNLPLESTIKSELLRTKITTKQ